MDSDDITLPFLVLPLAPDMFNTCRYSNWSIDLPEEIYTTVGQSFDGYFYLYSRLRSSVAIEIDTSTLSVTVLPLFQNLTLLDTTVFIGYRTFVVSSCASMGAQCGPCVMTRYLLSNTSSPLLAQSVPLNAEPYDFYSSQTVEADVYLLSINQKCNENVVSILRVDLDLQLRGLVTFVSRRMPKDSLFLDSASQILYITITNSYTITVLGFSVPRLELVSNNTLPLASSGVTDGLIHNGYWYRSIALIGFVHLSVSVSVSLSPSLSLSFR
jgi:hypothetical protein